MKMGKPSGSLWALFGALIIAAFALNWLWEMIQMPAFSTTAGHSWRDTALTCTVASMADAAITLVIYAVVALVMRRWRWALQATWKNYVAAAALGAVVAVVIEKVSILSGFWGYTSRMPVVPVLGAGLWPILQLTLLVPLALGIAAWWTRRAAGSGASRERA